MRAPDPIPLLIPDMPGAAALMPYLQRMDAARCYTNFGPLVQELEQSLRQRFDTRLRLSGCLRAGPAALFMR